MLESQAYSLPTSPNAVADAPSTEEPERRFRTYASHKGGPYSCKPRRLDIGASGVRLKQARGFRDPIREALLNRTEGLASLRNVAA